MKAVQIIKGFAKLALVELNAFDMKRYSIDRWNICESCPLMTKSKICGKCGCYVPAKVLVKSAACPKEKW